MKDCTSEVVRVCGRDFTPGDIRCIRGIIADESSPHRREIARRTCESLAWLRPDGRLKEMSCRVALLRLQDRGMIQLPPPRNGNANGRPYRARNLVVEPADPVCLGVGQLDDPRLRVVRRRGDSHVWNEIMARYHYLGYTPLVGAQMRYLLEADGQLLGALGFAASAWKIAPRDRWIGWSAAQREAHLHLVVGNARFLLLPWVQSRNLASWVLGRCARRLPSDWEEQYGYRPSLLETFVDRSRFEGTCYRAANWAYLGDTRGRGKLDRQQQYAVPVKRIFVLPLHRSFREQLCS